MSLHTISQYYTEVDKIYQYGGNKKETAIRNCFYNLLNTSYAQPKDLLLIPELDHRLPSGKIVFPDGTLKDALRLDWGYWESKDSNDDLNREIDKKFAAGYPNANILFEDSQTAVLFQDGAEVGRCTVRDSDALDKLLTKFVGFTRPEVKGFRQALDSFKADVPRIATTLREMIDRQNQTNGAFKQAQTAFLTLCKESINADVTGDDVNEMLIQHILTEDIFTTVFDDPTFHQENNISQELHKLEATFFTGTIKRSTLDSIKPYYAVIKTEASRIANHTEKQRFLKVMYENFYKAYNPKAADRLGIVYTPDEIVKFMLESTDYLLHKHFGKILASDGVEILDPATGTGTFISDLIDYLPKDKLANKYKNEIHCNEVAILPYYIANLNIEATFKQKMGYYEEFKNICFVDTLDNVGFGFAGKQTNMFGSMSAENAVRVKAQNARKISVVIGNPPYNARQENYNYQNANRAYGQIDKRIKGTFVKNGTAQNQTVIYDMYTRFYRWAMDRLSDNGIIAFVTNRSFIDSKAFDGFRKSIQDEYTYAYIVDTKSDVRTNPKISGTKNNVFGIQTGVAILFLIKQPKKKDEKCQIRYASMPDEWTRKDKLKWFEDNPLKEIGFDFITPDIKNNWLKLSDNNFDTLLPIFDRNSNNRSLFNFYSLGINTNRDEWIYSFNKKELMQKISFFIEKYNTNIGNAEYDLSIKWSSSLESYHASGRKVTYDEKLVILTQFRPFVLKYHYSEKLLNHRLTQSHYEAFGGKLTQNNLLLGVNMNGREFNVLASNRIVDLHFNGDTQFATLYRYDANGNRIDNITDWGLQQFQVRFAPSEALVP